MADVTVQKRGEVYQYKFEITSIDGKKFKNKYFGNLKVPILRTFVCGISAILFWHKAS